jgi:hypothetical protein
MYLDYSSFVDGHVLKRLEDALLVPCWVMTFSSNSLPKMFFEAPGS